METTVYRNQPADGLSDYMYEVARKDELIDAMAKVASCSQARYSDPGRRGGKAQDRNSNSLFNFSTRYSGGGSGGRVLEENGRHAKLIVPVAINKGLRTTISLKKGNSVQLIGLGTFSATAPKKVAKFKAGKALADTVK